MRKDYATFNIGFKILLRKGDKVLFLRMAHKKYFNLLDLPGGRADKGEEGAPLKRILIREIKEEIGKRVKYKFGNLAFQNWRHDRSRKIYTLINVYEARYLSGEIKLSPEHLSYEWINPKKYKFRKKDFFNKEEYLAFKEYLKF